MTCKAAQGGTLPPSKTSNATRKVPDVPTDDPGTSHDGRKPAETPLPLPLSAILSRAKKLTEVGLHHPGLPDSYRYSRPRRERSRGAPRSSGEQEEMDSQHREISD